MRQHKIGMGSGPNVQYNRENSATIISISIIIYNHVILVVLVVLLVQGVLATSGSGTKNISTSCTTGIRSTAGTRYTSSDVGTSGTAAGAI